MTKKNNLNLGLIQLSERFHFPPFITYALANFEHCEFLNKEVYANFSKAFKVTELGQTDRKFQWAPGFASDAYCLNCILAALPEQKIALINGSSGVICPDRATACEIFNIMEEADWSMMPSTDIHYVYAMDTNHYIDMLNSPSNILYNVENVKFEDKLDM